MPPALPELPSRHQGSYHLRPGPGRQRVRPSRECEQRHRDRAARAFDFLRRPDAPGYRSDLGPRRRSRSGRPRRPAPRRCRGASAPARRRAVPLRGGAAARVLDLSGPPPGAPGPGRAIQAAGLPRVESAGRPRAEGVGEHTLGSVSERRAAFAPGCVLAVGDLQVGHRLEGDRAYLTGTCPFSFAQFATLGTRGLLGTRNEPV